MQIVEADVVVVGGGGALPLVAFPLAGIASMDETAAPYASSVVFLFLGGLILALGIQRCGLDRRIAFHTLWTS